MHLSHQHSEVLTIYKVVAHFQMSQCSHRVKSPVFHLHQERLIMLSTSNGRRSKQKQAWRWEHQAAAGHRYPIGRSGSSEQWWWGGPALVFVFTPSTRIKNSHRSILMLVGWKQRRWPDSTSRPVQARVDILLPGGWNGFGSDDLVSESWPCFPGSGIASSDYWINVC